MAALHKDGKSRLLVKATGGLAHGGDDVLKPDSTGYRILAEFVRRLDVAGRCAGSRSGGGEGYGELFRRDRDAG